MVWTRKAFYINVTPTVQTWRLTPLLLMLEILGSHLGQETQCPCLVYITVLLRTFKTSNERTTASFRILYSSLFTDNPTAWHCVIRAANTEFQQTINNARIRNVQFFMAGVAHVAVFCVVTSRRINMSRCFGRMCCLQLQGDLIWSECWSGWEKEMWIIWEGCKDCGQSEVWEGMNWWIVWAIGNWEFELRQTPLFLRNVRKKLLS
jgi:hypothetical protein